MFLLLISLGIFALYFYLIGATWLSFLPFFIILLLFFYYFKIFNLKHFFWEFLLKHSLIFALFLISLGIGGILYLSGFSLIQIILILLSLSMIFLIFGYIFDYGDGKFLGWRSYIFLNLILLIYLFAFNNLKLYNLVYFVVGNFAFLTFLIFSLRISDNFLFVNWLFFVDLLLGFVIYRFFGVNWMIFFDFIFGSFLLYFFVLSKASTAKFFVSGRKDLFFLDNFDFEQESPSRNENIQVKDEVDILKNFLTGKIEFESKSEIKSGLKAVIKKISRKFLLDGNKNYFFPVLNLFFVILSICVYISNLPAKSLIFWFQVFVTFVFYTWNIILLKKVRLNLGIENVFFLILLDFLVYYLIYSFTQDWVLKSLLGILWTSIWFYKLFFWQKYSFLEGKVGFLTAIFLGIVNVILNLYFLGNVAGNGQFLFFLGMIYVGITIYILNYLFRSIKKFKLD